jgi:hypothetical protein
MKELVIDSRVLSNMKEREVPDGWWLLCCAGDVRWPLILTRICMHSCLMGDMLLGVEMSTGPPIKAGLMSNHLRRW